MCNTNPIKVPFLTKVRLLLSSAPDPEGVCGERGDRARGADRTAV